MKKLVALGAAAAIVLAACTGTVEEDATPTFTPEVEINLDDSVVASDENGVSTICDQKFIDTSKFTVDNRQPGDVLAIQSPVSNNVVDQRRVLYVSTLADTNQKVIVCGSMYTKAASSQNDSKKVMVWTHGTVGLRQKCMPSSAKDLSLTQEPKAGGLGDQLTQLVNQGFTVLAPDYYAGLKPSNSGPNPTPYQPYAAGPAEARNTLDIVRAVFPYGAEFSVWGHSQGGGSSMWTGQLASTYLPSNYDLKSVVAAAPASQFTTQDPTDPYIGYHLGDRDAYNFVSKVVPLGPILFSFVLGPWQQMSTKVTPNGQLAAGPYVQGGLNINAVATSQAQTTIGKMDDFCINLIKSSLVNDKKLLGVLATYDRPNAKPFFADPFQGFFNPSHPANAETGRATDEGKASKSAIDATCVGQTDAGSDVKAWCDWLTWNNPGPNGTSNMPKYPRNQDGQLVPLMINQGLQDNIVWCMSSKQVPVQPDPKECLASQLVDSMQITMGSSLVSNWYPNADHFGVMADSAQASADFIIQAHS